MKKLLALVLALVMTLGLATVSASAAYSDEADVSLEEAVDVMSAVGVFQGSDGKFSPKENLTREQAAKLIAYLDLGESAAEALPAVKVFDDVEATRWSAKYIAYCQDAGYIAGVGNGKFNPAGELTGYAFGKMILCVLGYDASVEGFTGNTWSLNVAKLMENNDIADGVNSAASLTLTREQAAQYCLNALKATTVDYDTKGTNITINGAVIATGASKAEAVYSGAAYSDEIKKGTADADGKYTLQLGEKRYEGDLKCNTTATTDAFGAPATKWTYKNTKVGTYTDTPDASYFNKVTMATIYELLGKDVVDDLNDGNAKIYLTVDGVTTNIGDNNNGKNYVKKGSTGAAFTSDNGTITDVYVDSDGEGGTYAKVTVIVKNVYVMQANSDYNTKTEKLSVTERSGKASVTTLEAKDYDDLEGFKEDDYILYTCADGHVETIEKANVVSGKVTTWVNGKSVTLDGTKYNYSKNGATAATKATTFSINDTAKIVVDGQNNIVYVDEAKASNDDILFVTEVKNVGYAVQAKVVNTDGTKALVTVDTADSKNSSGTKIFDGKTDLQLAALAGNFYAYEVDGSQYELTPYAKQDVVNGTQDYDTDGVYGNAYGLNKATTLVGYYSSATYTANSKTVYIVADEDDDITVYTGVKNAPDITNGCTPVVFAYNNTTDKEITYLFVKSGIENGIDDATDTSELIYVMKVGGDVITAADKTKYVEVKALVDGEEQTLKVKEANKSAFSVGTLYKNLKTNADGYVTGVGSAIADNDDYDIFTTSGTGSAAFNYSDGVFTAGSYSKFIETDKVYVIVTGGALLDDAAASYELTETTFQGLKNFVNGYNVTADCYTTLNNDGEVTAAYINIKTSTEV